MTEERWRDLVSTIQDRFPDVQRGQRPLEDELGTVEFVEFTSPAGHIRLECELRPRVTGIKSHGGIRGKAPRITKEYSPHETMAAIIAFRKVGDQWQEIDAASFL